MKRFVSVMMVLFMLFIVCSPHTVSAEEETGTISQHLFRGHTDEIYKGKYYQIDTAPEKQKEDEGAIKKAWGYIFGDDDLGKDIQRRIYSLSQWMVDLAFQFNVIIVKGLLFVVDQAFTLDIVSLTADKLAVAMQNIAGVGVGGFTNGGLFPSIITLMCALSACYAAYILFIKRQPTAGLNEVIKTVLVIAGIIVFISNASSILKTANTISSEISLTILSKATGTVAGDVGRTQEEAVAAVKKQIWTLLVDRPYLFQQYGEDDKEKIGEDRVNKLLSTPPGEERATIAGDEVKKNKNLMMQLEFVGERIIFTFIYYLVNMITGLPIIGFCLLVIAFSLWFLVISIIAPIAMAVALVPGNRRVIWSWLNEWARPLGLKILMSVVLVVIFTISELIYTLPESGIAGYVSTMVLQIVVFLLCYIFRDRLTAAFSASRRAYQAAMDLQLMSERAVGYGKDFVKEHWPNVYDEYVKDFKRAGEEAAANLESNEENTRGKQELISMDLPENLSELPSHTEAQDKTKSQRPMLTLIKGEAEPEHDSHEQEEKPVQQAETAAEEVTVSQASEEPIMPHKLMSLEKEGFAQFRQEVLHKDNSSHEIPTASSHSTDTTRKSVELTTVPAAVPTSTESISAPTAYNTSTNLPEPASLSTMEKATQPIPSSIPTGMVERVEPMTLPIQGTPLESAPLPTSVSSMSRDIPDPIPARVDTNGVIALQVTSPVEDDVYREAGRATVGGSTINPYHKETQQLDCMKDDINE